MRDQRDALTDALDLLSLATDEIRWLVNEGWSAAAQRRALTWANYIERREVDIRRYQRRLNEKDDE